MPNFFSLLFYPLLTGSPSTIFYFLPQCFLRKKGAILIFWPLHMTFIFLRPLVSVPLLFLHPVADFPLRYENQFRVCVVVFWGFQQRGGG